MPRFPGATLLTPVSVAATVLTLSVASTTTAHADVGGEVPSPGLCDYPGVGSSHMIGAGPFSNVYVYYCDFPTEINGSHWHAELAGDAVQSALSAGITIAFFSAGGSLGGNLGYVGGSTSWRCPDMTLAEAPNPPGAWKDHITPAAKCKTVGPNPDLPPPDDHATGAVTNPDNPNPLATVNPN